MYMAYVKSKRMGSKKRKARKTRRIKGGGNNEGKPIDTAITMLDKVKQILEDIKSSSAPPAEPSENPSAEPSSQSD
jgi:hypothetical protein